MSHPGRDTVFWWAYVAVLAGAALFIAHTFVGVLVLGLFGYYATRPICCRIERGIDSRRLAAVLTALAVLLPVLLLTAYAGLRTVQQLRQRFEGGVVASTAARAFGLDVEESGSLSLLADPPSLEQLFQQVLGSGFQQGLQVLDALFGTVMLLGLSMTLSYALLVHDRSLADTFAQVVGGRDETVYGYSVAVDTDLESIFFGNLLFVLLMSVVATATYALTNLVAPPGLAVPMVFTLGFLTGLTSLVPVVVSKVVYLPVVAYLALSTASGDGSQYAFVGGVLVVYFLVLDILPQSVVQPYISGRQLNPMVLLFAYLLGPIMFGWYGFFLMPILLVLMIEAVRIVVPELLHGEPIAAEPVVAEETGADPEEMNEEWSDGSTGPQDESTGPRADHPTPPVDPETPPHETPTAPDDSTTPPADRDTPSDQPSTEPDGSTRAPDDPDETSG